MKLVLSAGIIAFAAISSSAQHTIDISGMQSWGLDGDPQNQLNVFIVPQNGFGVILGIHYDITIETIDGSWLEEVNIRFGNSDGTFDGNWPDTFAPGAGDSFSGTQRYTGFFNTDIHLNPDSEFYISLFESFDDNAGLPDAVLLAGSTMTFEYFIPTPGTNAILAVGLLTATRRRR